MSDVTLLDIPVWLLSNALEDPAFDLALMCLLTDPFHDAIEDYREYVDGDDDALTAGLAMAQRYYPEDYADFCIQYWCLEATEFEKQVHETLMQYFPTKETVYGTPDAFHYQWVPIEFLGIDLENFEAWQGLFDSDAMKQFLAMFEVTWNENKSYPDDHCAFSSVRDIASTIITDALIKETERQECSIFDNLCLLIRWFSNGTGNTILDYSHDSFIEWGYEAMGWDNIEAIQQTQSEAYQLMEMVYAGIDALEANPMLLHSLIANYTTVYRSVRADLEEGININDRSYEFTGSLCWARPDLRGSKGFTETQCNTGVFRLWRDDAYRDSILRRRSEEAFTGAF